MEVVTDKVGGIHPTTASDDCDISLSQAVHGNFPAAQETIGGSYPTMETLAALVGGSNPTTYVEESLDGIYPTRLSTQLSEDAGTYPAPLEVGCCHSTSVSPCRLLDGPTVHVDPIVIKDCFDEAIMKCSQPLSSFELKLSRVFPFYTGVDRYCALTSHGSTLYDHDIDWMAKQACSCASSCQCFSYWSKSPEFREMEHCGTIHGMRFYRSCRRILNAYLQVLSNDDIMNEQSRAEVLDNLQRNPYWIMMENSAFCKQASQKCPDLVPKFLNLLTYLRNGSMFLAQADDEPVGWLGSIITWLRPRLGRVSGIKDDIAAFVSSMVERFFSTLDTFCTVKAFTVALKKIKDNCIAHILSIFGLGFITTIKSWSREKIAGYGIMIMISVLSFMKFITDPVLMALKDFALSVLSKGAGLFVAQGAEAALTLASTVIFGVLGSALVGFNRVSQIMKNVSMLVSGTKAAGSIFSMLYLLLPIGLQTAILYSCGSAQDITQSEYDEWNDQSMALLKVSKVPEMLIDPEYADSLDACIATGRKFANLNLGIRGIYVHQMVNMARISSEIYKMKHRGGNRAEPWCVHICGEPGVGKTLFAKNFLEDVTGFSDDTTYKRVGTKFWDGYASERAIIFDEWLTTEDKIEFENSKTEFLNLIATGMFMPDLASVDSIAVGMKGTTCAPKVVVTMNNTAYNTAGTNDGTLAIQRRRKHVIYMGYRSDAHMKDDKVNISAYTDKEIKQFAWAYFKVLPAIHKFERVKVEPKINYGALVTFMRTSYEAQLALVDRVASALGGIIESDRVTPAASLKEVMKEFRGLPTKPISIVEYFADLAADMVAQNDAPARTRKRALRRDRAAELLSQNMQSDLEPVEEASDESNDEYETAKEDPEIDISLDLESFTIDREVDNLDMDPDTEISQIVPTPSTFWERVKNHRYSHRAFKLVTILMAGYAVAKLVSSLLTNCCADPDDYVTEDSYSPKKKNQSRKARYYALTRFTDFKGQSETWYVRITVNNVSQVALSLGDGWFITYAHGIAPEFEAGAFTLNMTYAEKEYTYDLNKCITRMDHDKDVFMFHVDGDRPMTKKVISRFINNEQLASLTSTNVSLDTESRCVEGRAEKVHEKSYLSNDLQRYTQQSPLLFYGRSVSGDCGYMYQVTCGSLEGKFVAMHVAGARKKTTSNAGLGTFITQEYIRMMQRGNRNETIDDGVDFVAECESVGPGIVASEEVPEDERVYLPRRSKLMASCLQPYLLSQAGFPALKQPSVLHHRDYRGDGTCPISNAIAKVAEIERPPVDQTILDGVTETCIKRFEEQLIFPIGKRKLTLREAIEGIPALLSSLRLDSGPGWPHALTGVKGGKRSWIWFEGDKACWSEDLERLVKEFRERRLNGTYKRHIWLGYLKDELRVDSKVKTCATRVTWASDFIATIDFRMELGCLLIAFNQSSGHTSMGIGLNQYSYDMQSVYDWLVSLGGYDMVAGDFRGFDMHHHPQFQTAGYDFFVHFARQIPGISEVFLKFFRLHECDSWAQIGNQRFKMLCAHFSGCFLTTIMNCIVNELYLRYSFAISHPGLVFDKTVKVKTLGDDHIYSVVSGVDFTGGVYQKVLASFGQIYTGTDKSTDIGPYRTFEEVSFLGARPVKIDGIYSGAACTDMLMTTPMWTRDHNVSVTEVVEQCLGFASQHERAWYDEYASHMRSACVDADVPFPEVPSYLEYRRIVANRVARPENLFVAESSEMTEDEYSRMKGLHTWFDSLEFVAQGDVESPMVGATGTSEMLTTMQVPDLVTTEVPRTVDRAEIGLPARDMTLSFALDSYMYRGDVVWNSDHGTGDTLFSYNVPYDILQKGDADNIQNMPFYRYLYWRSDVKFMFQVNATPFMQGLVCIFWYPLSDQRPNVDNVPACHCVWVQPNRNTTGEITIPFVYPRNAINTLSFATKALSESLGHLHCYVFSKLMSGEAKCECTISIYSAFPNCKFTLPRPKNTSALGIEDDVENFYAQGTTSSKTVNNVGKVMGAMTTETKAQGHTIKTKVPVNLDNPMLASGAIPTYNQFSGMSKAVGVEPTVGLQLDPSAISQQNSAHFEHDELTVKYLCSKRCYVSPINWKASQANNTELLKMNLNSLLGITVDAAGLPLCLAVINQCIFWRADFVFDFQVVRTDYASGRLRAVVGYGAKSLSAATQNIYMNQVFDYSGSNDTFRFVVPYNAQTEFLRTYEGSAAPDAQQNYSLGWLGIYVANRLRTASSVADNVNLLIFVSLENVKIAVPRPMPLVNTSAKRYKGGMWAITTYTKDPPQENALEEFEAQSDAVVMVDDQGGDDPSEVVKTAVTGTNIQTVTDQLVPGEKFEHCVSNILEFGRRYHNFEGATIENEIRYFADAAKPTVIGKIFYFDVQPSLLPFCNFYLGWSGTIKFRIFSGAVANDFYVSYYPSSYNYKPPNVSNDTPSMFHTPGVAPLTGTKIEERTPVIGDYYYAVNGTGTSLASGPVEKFYSVPAGGYIDVACPFQSHFSFLPTVTINHTSSVGGGMLTVRCTNGEFSIYMSLGDDFRYLGFRPPWECNVRRVADSRTTLAKTRVCSAGGQYISNT